MVVIDRVYKYRQFLSCVMVLFLKILCNLKCVYVSIYFIPPDLTPRISSHCVTVLENVIPLSFLYEIHKVKFNICSVND
jgi:hypothetical protein